MKTTHLLDCAYPAYLLAASLVEEVKVPKGIAVSIIPGVYGYPRHRLGVRRSPKDDNTYL